MALDLRTVVLVPGVGDGQVGDLERLRRFVQLVVGGHRQAEPAEPVLAPLRGEIGDGVGLQDPLALDIPRGIDDHRSPDAATPEVRRVRR